VKKLRRQEIQSYEATNEYLEAEYLAGAQPAFARESGFERRTIRSGTERSEAERGLPVREERWISNDWVVQYRGQFSATQTRRINAMAGPAQAVICEWEDGAVEVHYAENAGINEDLVVRPRNREGRAHMSRAASQPSR